MNRAAPRPSSGRRRPRLRDRRRAGSRIVCAGGFHRILDRIDAGLLEGGIDATLPDGSDRILGGRAPGPMPVVHLHSWRALVRLISSGSVGWYKAWAHGEWSSPDPVPLFDLFMRNGESLGDVARAKGTWRGWSTGSPICCARNSKARARRNIAHHYDLGNDFYAAWLDPGMTYSSALFADRRGEPLEAAQERKIRALARPARSQARPAPARDRLRLGLARRDRRARLWRPRRRPDPVGRAEGLCRRAHRQGRPVGPGRDRADRLSRRRRRLRRGRQRRDGRGGRAANIGRPICRRIARVLKPGGRAAIQYHRDRASLCSTPMRRAPISSRPISSPAACCSASRASRAIAERRRARLARPPRLRPRLCRDLAALAAALRRGGRRGAAAAGSTPRSTPCGAII